MKRDGKEDPVQPLVSVTGRQGMGGFMSIGKNRPKIYMEKDTQVGFSDMAGVEEVLEHCVQALLEKETPISAAFAKAGGSPFQGLPRALKQQHVSWTQWRVQQTAGNPDRTAAHVENFHPLLR